MDAGHPQDRCLRGLAPAAAQAEETTDAAEQVHLLGLWRAALRGESIAHLVEIRAARADDAAHAFGDLRALEQQALERLAFKAVALDVGLRDHRRAARIA